MNYKNNIAYIIITVSFFVFSVYSYAQTPLPADYPGVGLAYGLRKLKSDYNGALIQVAKWDGVSETTQDIGMVNGKIDYEALKSFFDSVQVNEETYIKVWYDQSGNNVHAIQNDRNKAPKIVINNGVKLFFENTTLLPSGPNPSFTDFSLFAYLTPSSLRNFENTFIKGSVVNDKIALKSPSKAVMFGMNTTTNTITSTTTLNTNTNTLINVTRANVNSTLYIDGFFDTSGNVGVNPFQIVEIGGTNFSGYIYEVVFYNNSTNDTQVTNNIINYWQTDSIQGITTYTHPITGDTIVYEHTTTDGEAIQAAALWALVFYFIYIRVVKVIKGR